MSSPEVIKAANGLLTTMLESLSRDEMKLFADGEVSALECRKCKKSYDPQVHVMPLHDSDRVHVGQFTIIRMSQIDRDAALYLVRHNITKFENFGAMRNGLRVALRRPQAHLCSDKCHGDLIKDFGKTMELPEGWRDGR